MPNLILDMNTMLALVIMTIASCLSIMLSVIILCAKKIGQDIKTKKIRRRVPDYNPPVKHRTSLSTKLLIAIVIFILSIEAVLLAACYQAHIRTIPYKDLTLGELPAKIQTTHVEDTLPEDLRGSIVFFYKYNCPDCELAYRNLALAKSKTDKIYFCASDSKQGEKLVELYQIENVPSGIYVHQDYTFTNIFLCTTDENGTRFDHKALNRLLQLQKEQR